MRAISEEQIEAFKADGYLHLPRYLDESALDATKQALKKVMDKINTFRSEEIYYEDKEDPASLKQIQHLENKEEFFQHLISTGTVYELAQELLQEEPIPKKYSVFQQTTETHFSHSRTSRWLLFHAQPLSGSDHVAGSGGSR
jgi:phytanoyl-CoA hydroxylase